MMALKRLPEPRVLTENKARWSEKFQAERAQSPKKRPSTSQYAHKEVVQALQAMSFHKCFYCEQSTKQAKPEVDHYIEVSERPDLAFEWTNLYLSCRECNDKLPVTSIPPSDCLDPCALDVRPEEHLTFEDEIIRPRSESPIGAATIRKYRLDRDDLDLKRLRQLQHLRNAVDTIKDRMNAEGRRAMTREEEVVLRMFRQPDYPFSLMFKIKTEAMGL
jgi:5-methylcytosine-specific restriction endonuclease McrA